MSDPIIRSPELMATAESSGRAHIWLSRPPERRVEEERREAIDLTQAFNILRRRLPTLLFIATLTLVVVIGLTLAARMDFRSSARMYLGELETARASNRSAKELEISDVTPGDMASEMEIIQSRSLVTDAILASGLNAELSPADSEPVRYWQWRISRRDPRLLDAAYRKLQLARVRLAQPGLQPQQYQLRFLSPQSYELWSAEPESRSLGTGQVGRLETIAGLQLVVTPKKGSGPVAGEAFDLVVTPVAVAVDDVLSALSVHAPQLPATNEQPKVVSLDFRHSSPRMAAAFLDELIEAYLQQKQEWKTEDASAAEQFVTDQLATMRTALDTTQRALADYQSDNQGIVGEDEAKALVSQMKTYEEQRVAARLEVSALSDAAKALARANPPPEAYMLGEAEDNVLADMASSLAKARRELTELDARYNSAAPELREQQAQVDAQLRSIRNYVNGRLSRARQNLATLNSVIKGFEERLRRVPQAELGLAKLSRESEVYSTLYSYLLERKQQAGILKASTVSKNRILDAPQVPLREASPRLGLRLAGAPLGLLIGAAFVLLSSALSSRFRSVHEVEASLVGLPVLGVVPRGQRKAEPQSRLQANLSGGRARAPDPSGPAFTEAFRMLRTNLYQMLPRQRGSLIVFTSATPGDGKSTCARALARALAADDKRVTIVETDFHSTDSTDSHDNDELHAALAGNYTWGGHTATQRVQVLRIPAAEAAEVFSSQDLVALLREGRQHVDYVIVDAPSFPLLGGALMLASEADCLISVIRTEHTPRKLAAEHVRRLIPGGARQHAVLINDPARTRPSREPYAPPSHPTASEPHPEGKQLPVPTTRAAT